MISVWSTPSQYCHPERNDKQRKEERKKEHEANTKASQVKRGLIKSYKIPSVCCVSSTKSTTVWLTHCRQTICPAAQLDSRKLNNSVLIFYLVIVGAHIYTGSKLLSWVKKQKYCWGVSKKSEIFTWRAVLVARQTAYLGHHFHQGPHILQNGALKLHQKKQDYKVISAEMLLMPTLHPLLFKVRLVV